MIPDEAVILRLENSKRALKAWKEKAQNLRRVVNGDHGAFRGNMNQAEEVGFESAPWSQSWVAPDLGKPILRRTFQEAQPNYIFQQLKTLVRQVSWTTPDWDFPGRDPYEALLFAAYLRKVLGEPPQGCGAATVKQLQLWDCLVTGLGAAAHWMRNGRPCVEHLDPVRCLWDIDVPLVMMHRWRACAIRMTLDDAVETFGKAAFKAELEEHSQPDTPGAVRMLELIYYYSREGETGQFAVVNPARIGQEGAMVHTGPNPVLYSDDGWLNPGMPIQLEAYAEVPGNFQPIGLVDDMLPHQQAISLGMRQVVRMVNLSSGFRIFDGAVISPGQFEEVMQGRSDEVAIDTEKLGSRGVNDVFINIPGVEVQPAAMQFVQQQLQTLVGMGGVNPYATGQLPGVQYATEAKQVQAQGDLNANHAAEAYAQSWAFTGRMAMVMGAAYDETPVQLDVLNARIGFNGPGEPLLSEFLDPAAEIEVRADTVKFESRESRQSRRRALTADAAALGRPEAMTLMDQMLRDEGVAPNARPEAQGQMQ